MCGYTGTQPSYSWDGVSGFGRIRSRIGFRWIRVDFWTPESESANAVKQ